MTYLSYHCDQTIRSARIERAKAHVAANRLTTEAFIAGDGLRGTSVGCDIIDVSGPDTVTDNPYQLIANHDGTPEWLECLRDEVFHGLAPADRAWWHVEIAHAIPVGVNLTPQYHRIMIEVLEMAMAGYSDSAPCVSVAKKALDAHHRAARGVPLPESDCLRIAIEALELALAISPGDEAQRLMAEAVAWSLSGRADAAADVAVAVMTVLALRRDVASEEKTWKRVAQAVLDILRAPC